MTEDTTNPTRSISTTPDNNDVSVISASSSGTSSSPEPASPGVPSSSLSIKSKSFKKQGKKVMSSIRRSSSMKKMTDKLSSIGPRSKAVSKGIIQKYKRKVPVQEELSSSLSSKPETVSIKNDSAEEAPLSPIEAQEDGGSSKYDEVTCFNVELDSLPAGMEGPVLEDNASLNNDSLLQEESTTIVLLLLDGRRFELLQLEMNATTATVQDIINQISIESTDKTLRNQTYVGICEKNGIELDMDIHVSDYFPYDVSKYYVAMAIPDSMNRNDVVKFSKPIFSDTNISTMFRKSKQEGTSIAKLVPKNDVTSTTTEEQPKIEQETVTSTAITPKKTNETVETQQPQAIKKTTTTTEVAKKKSNKDSFLRDKFFNNNSSKKDLTKKKEKKKVKEEEKMEVLLNKQTASVKKEEESVIVAAKEKRLDIKNEVKEKAVLIQQENTSIVDVSKNPISPTISKSSNYIFTVIAILLSIIPIIIMIQHKKLYSPMQPNDELKIGQWRSSCGLFRFFPDDNFCDESILLRMEDDGSLTLHNEKTNITYWKMRSLANCDNDNCSAVLNQNGFIEIGGQSAAIIVESKKEKQQQQQTLPSDFNGPWPFHNEQIVSTWPFSINVNLKPKRKKIHS